MNVWINFCSVVLYNIVTVANVLLHFVFVENVVQQLTSCYNNIGLVQNTLKYKLLLGNKYCRIMLSHPVSKAITI